LRYAHSNNNIKDIDFVPAIGVKFNVSGKSSTYCNLANMTNQ